MAKSAVRRAHDLINLIIALALALDGDCAYPVPSRRVSQQAADNEPNGQNE